MANTKKAKAPSWSDLTPKQREFATRRLISTVKAMSGARYKIVTGTDQHNREMSQVEYKDEDGILNSFERNRILNVARNQVRNSPQINGILKQFDFNVVGVNGGKVILSFEDDELNKDIKREFSRYTQNIDFFDGLSLNTVLKIILKTYLIGSDMVLIVDHDLVTGRGKLILIEGDEIGNVSDNVLKKHYGKDATQSQGRVYDKYGRNIGVICSRSQRGKDVFDEEGCWFLKSDPDDSKYDSFWMMPRNIFRISQGRGVGQLTSALANNSDLEDLINFELQAAKKNSQILANIYQETSKTEDGVIPSAFSAEEISQMTDEEINNAIKAQEEEEQTSTITLDRLNAANCIYQVLPENFRMELLDTSRPNANMPEFIRFLASRTGMSLGISQQYCTLLANGSDYRSQMLMSLPAFQECQKFLEGICDWIFDRWLKHQLVKGVFDANRIPEDYMRYVDWHWVKPEEIDQKTYIETWAMKLKMGLGTYKEFYGNDWKEKLSQIELETATFREKSIPHPMYEMISGGERTGAEDNLTME